MSLVLDASAVLAYLQNEAGAAKVAAGLDGALVSTVNWSEVLQKSIKAGVNIDGMAADFMALGVQVSPFTPEQAETAAELWNRTRHYGLSLADRACLSLAMESASPVLTADRVWAELELELDIRVVR